MRLWWRARRPSFSCASVALWWEQQLLVVRTSYHDMYDLPGGGLDRGEAPLDAALRELREEIGLEAAPSALSIDGIYHYDDMGRRITAHIFAYHPSQPPQPMIDRREVVWAGLVPRLELEGRRISPQLIAYLGATA